MIKKKIRTNLFALLTGKYEKEYLNLQKPYYRVMEDKTDSFCNSMCKNRYGDGKKNAWLQFNKSLKLVNSCCFHFV